MFALLWPHVRQFGKPGRTALLVIACLSAAWALGDRARAASPAPVSRIIVALDANPDFLLALAPMLREWQDAQLLVATEGLRASVTGYVERYPEAEVWVLQLGAWELKVANRRQRVLRGDADHVLQKLRAECWPQPNMAVLADTSDRQQATLGSVLAAAHRAPLYLLDCKKASSGPPPVVPPVPRIVCVGRAEQWPAQRILPGAQWSYAQDPDEIIDAYAKSLKLERIEHLVVMNPVGKAAGKEAVELSSLAVPYALRHRAAIWFAGNAEDADKRIAGILEKKYPHVRYVTILGDEACLPPTEVPDPAAPRPAASGIHGQTPGPEVRVDAAERVEDPECEEIAAAAAPPVAAPPPAAPPPAAPPAAQPPSGGDNLPKTVAPEILSGVRFRQPCIYRVGRITGSTLASASLLAANGQSRKGASATAAPVAWMMANVGDKGLPLLECLARSAARNCAAHGWQMATYYGAQNGPIKTEPFLAADLIMYQGHTADLGKFTAVHQQLATMPPSLFLLQGCFTLRQAETVNLLQSGAAGVVGATSNMYSASGGAFAGVFLDTLLGNHDAGTSLMVARNYLLALTLLKERRGHQQAGKPLRAAMTFSLWGDPTWEPHGNAPAPPTLQGVRAVRKGPRVGLHIPASWLEESRAGPYLADIPMDGQLAGIYTTKSAKSDQRQLVPLYFAVLPIENWRGDGPPQVSSTLAAAEWVSLWDSHNGWLYLLVRGRTGAGRDHGKVISFDLH
jgi:hypothetical protein